jgi:hypothetical protein
MNRPPLSNVGSLAGGHGHHDNAVLLRKRNFSYVDIAGPSTTPCHSLRMLTTAGLAAG